MTEAGRGRGSTAAGTLLALAVWGIAPTAFPWPGRAPEGGSANAPEPVPGGAPSAASRDLEAALARLASASAAERSAGERELARTLRPADLDRLAAAVEGGGLELRSRVASALASDSRLFPLAAALAARAESVVAWVGREALAGHAAAWLGASDQEPLPLSSLERELAGKFSGAYRLPLAGHGLEETLDRIARLVDARREDRPVEPLPPLVLDPAFDERGAKPLAGAEDLGPEAVGGFEDLVFSAAVSHGAVFDVYGWEQGRTWIVVRSPKASGAEPARRAQALLAAWVLAVQRGDTDTRSPGSVSSGARSSGAIDELATRSARALAATGWPAALLWLDERFRSQGDEAALAGLLLAAGRGAVAPSLGSADGAARLLERADRALAGPVSGPAFAASGNGSAPVAELARALQAIGPRGQDGWTRGFATAPEGGRILRAAAATAIHAAPEALRTDWLARATQPSTTPRERAAVLRALAALEDPPTIAAAPGLEAALQEAAPRREARELLRALRRLGTAPPAAWSTPEDLRGLAPAALEALCADGLARFAAGDHASAAWAERLGALLARPDGEERALALFDHEGLALSRDALRGSLAAAVDLGLDVETLSRLSVCLGLAGAAEAEARAREVFSRDAWSVADWRVAGARVAREQGVLADWPARAVTDDPDLMTFLAQLDGVRDALREAAKAKSAPPPELAGLESGWVQGVSRALILLRAKQAEPGARELLRNLRLRFQRVEHPFRRELMAGRIPPPSPALLVDVEGREPWIGL